MIKSIAIENVRGIASCTFALDIIPNKPSLLVAPNGFGKSSLAAAFAALKSKRMELPKEQRHLGDESLAPKLTLTIRQNGQSSALVADGNSNAIAGVFDVYVVTSRLRAKATKHNMGNFTTATASLEISELVLVQTIPPKAHHVYDVAVMRARFGSSGKAFRNLGKTLASPVFADGLIELYGLMDKVAGVRIQNEITDMIASLQAQAGTGDEIRAWAVGTLAPRLESIEAIKELADLLTFAAGPGQPRIDALLSGLQVALTYLGDKKAFKDACKYLSYLNEKESFEDIIRAFGATWKKVKPIERKGSLVVSFPPAMHISNGQRDSLCFAAELRKIERSISSRDTILVIDEVFDYLDDANLVAVQYYITKLIKKVREKQRSVYPLILTHLNPYYFRNFTFASQKIYFLKKSKPAINKDFRALIAKRDEPSIRNFVGRHYLHYDPSPVDVRAHFQALGLRETWGDSIAFHRHTEAEWTKYFNESDNYDPFAVCCFVRVRIEKTIYDAIQDPARKSEFLNTSKTKNKLDFAVANGVDVDDSIYLLGIIYNEGMHVHDNVDDSSPIVSKLENRTIRHMIIESIGG
ncbi:ABC transporter ATP-binding protein [Pseudoxanthomonas jiangsuensis]|uniref:ABC transporter ATP-binding protein n=1 Tax=Pseudoxanthomonas jiangsuensis TaxID=619688 RepID=UPI001390AF92|nr:ABC transporter ATP-binding protein [Pseudoxanthomonas jiangsuensis]